MLKKGIDPDSPEAKIFGRNLLHALTEVFGRSILETGFFHAGMSKWNHPFRVFLCSVTGLMLTDELAFTLSF